jgi:hypothetical protein
LKKTNDARVAEWWDTIDKIGLAKAAAFFRWLWQHPDPDPPTPDMGWLDAFVASLNTRRNAQLKEIFRLSDEAPPPEIEAQVARVGDEILAERARLSTQS